jgi:hypothetical protein
MRKLLPSEFRGRSWSAARRFNGWLATWAQERRRGRPVGTPAAPAAPVITAINYDQGSIWLDFTCATPGLVSNYKIFRSVDEEVQDFYANQPAPASRFYDLSPSGGGGFVHYYWIIAEGPGGASDFSNLITVQYP